ncbi:hypothetical protein Tco_0385358 [Tanacetum coccineum]
MIPTTVPATAPIADLPVIHDDTPMIPTDTHTISAIDTSPAEITPSTRQILPILPGLPCRPAVLVIPGQPILVGRPYRTQPNGVHKMLTARKSVGPLPTHRLALKYSGDYSSSDHFTSDDASRYSSSDSSSMTSSDSHSDISSDSSLRHSSSDHSISDFPCDLLTSTSAGPYRKRHRSTTTSVPVASPIRGALSLVCADLSPPRKRIREIGFGVNVAYAMTWKALIKLMTEVEKYIGGLSDNIQGNVIVAEPTRLQDAICIANNFMDRNLKGYAIKNAENKRRAYTVRNNVERKGYAEDLPYFNKYIMHHKGSFTVKCGNYKRVGHMTRDCKAAVAATA